MTPPVIESALSPVHKIKQLIQMNLPATPLHPPPPPSHSPSQKKCEKPYFFFDKRGKVCQKVYQMIVVENILLFIISTKTLKAKSSSSDLTQWDFPLAGLSRPGLRYSYCHHLLKEAKHVVH